MGISAADSYPEEKIHNHAKYTYAPYLVVPRPAKIVKCGGATRVDYHVNVQAANLRCGVDQAMGGPAWTTFRFSFSLKANNPPMPSWRG